MDKVEQLIDKENKIVEADFKKNPLMLKVGQFVTLNDKGVYKLIKFSRKGKEVLVTVNLIFSSEGKKQNRYKPMVANIELIKPLITYLPALNSEIEYLTGMREFVLKNVFDINYHEKFDNVGNPIT